VVGGPMEAIDLVRKLDSKKSKRDVFDEMSYGAHEAPWLAYYDFFLEQLDVEECKDLEGLMDIAKTCGWLNMYEDVVVIQERPHTIRFDDQNRLHCEDGPAIEFTDGTKIYAWHGVKIPDNWIEKKSELSPKTALTWQNLEQRRCACEILGWARILRELDASVIDSDDDPMIGNLLEVDIPDIGREKFLQVVCGTGRTFAIPVPPEMKTALEANAWTYGLSPNDYKPEIRT
jgi:hypothetical protein